MTKQAGSDKEAGDRPAMEKLVYVIGSIAGSMKPIEGFNHATMETFERRNHRLTLQRLSISEAYLKGDALLYAFFERKLHQVPRGSIGMTYERKASHGRGICQNQFLDVHLLERGQKLDMLVGDVEGMNSEQVPSIASWKRLYVIKDMRNDTRTWSAAPFGMSFDGTFKVLPRSALSERESDVLVDRAAIRFDEDAVSVIESGPEIMDCIANDRWSVARKGLAKSVGDLPSITIELGPQSLFVRSCMSPENTFQLNDVVFGPFGL